MRPCACVSGRGLPAPVPENTPSRPQRRTMLRRQRFVSHAVALLGAAWAFRGVGALVEELCTQATLYGTELELEVSPRLDTSTEAVAVGIDGTIVASQETYDRLLLDKDAITELSGLDIPFKNLWSDRLWKGTVELTFTGAASLVDLEEGSPEAFNCMNDHYGMSFVKGEAEKDIATGTLTSEKVLNWSVLEPLYTSVEGITAFEPTAELVVPSTTNLVAASEENTASYHYFLSEPSADVDSSSCPEPCTGEIITYYWSITGGHIYQLDVASSDAEPSACWLPVFDEVADGPPPGGVTSWDLECITTLLDRMEEEEIDEILKEASATSDRGSSDTNPAFIVAVVVGPVILVTCVGALVMLQCRRQKARKTKKMKATDEAWGEGLDGMGGQKKPRPPTGRFTLGPIAPSTAAIGDANGDSGIPAPPTRGFSDVSMGSETHDGGGRPEGSATEALSEDEEDVGDGDMVYPLDV